MLEVRTATAADRRDVVRVMQAAFDDDPVMRWLVPETRSLGPLFAVHARWVHEAPGSTDIALLDGEPVGAAFWDPPGYRPPARRQVASILFYARALRRNLGRGVTLENLMHQARPDEEFWYLAGIGAVRRGEGIGTALLRHRLDLVTGPAYLESSKRANIPLYERFGFELRTSLRVPDGPELWPMWREV
ncbi:MAG TPA: GNAT family N-acetyltransferase [Nocardioides sp.]|uniref:GNAT family N-acetyltransferase n=1 Tax=Nocardioides sp. TaxID=35761 RepID=UPI002F3FF746